MSKKFNMSFVGEAAVSSNFEVFIQDIHVQKCLACLDFIFSGAATYFIQVRILLFAYCTQEFNLFVQYNGKNK